TPERPTSGEKSPAARKSPQNQGQRALWRRRRKGETMSMLIEAGFFPVQELIYANTQNGSMHLDIAETTDKDLPPTPGSISSTPIEMYHGQPPPRSPARAVLARKLGTSKGMRSPLSQLPAGDDDANADPQSTIAGQTQLTSIQEDETTSEAARVKSTMIRLRSGSVLTVTPPELTAWKRSVYVQGPIRLQPLITPRRKGSIASLEPFYSTAALDMIYQKALEIPRRRSDNAVMDEICDFFDDFGVGDDVFDGDRFSFAEPAVPIYVGEVNHVFESYAETFPVPPTFRYWAAAGDEAEFIDDNEPRKTSVQDEDIGPLEENPELEVPEPLFSPRILPGLPLPATDGEVVEEERMRQDDVSNLETPGAKTSSSASPVPTVELPTTPTDVDPRPTTTATAPTSPLGALIATAAEKYTDPSPPLPNPPDPTAHSEEVEDLPPSTHTSRTPSIGSLGSNLELYTTNSSTDEQEKQQQQQSSFEWDNETSSSRQQKLSPGLQQQQQQRQNKGGTVYKMRRFVRAAGAIL
ncbi:hypothetical protein LTR28_009824, partial [Elasticomyces elasticus]